MESKNSGLGQLILRLALGTGFLFPVADRLGWLGAPGSGDVTWGDWKHFTAYTHTLLPFLPEGLSNIFAFVATSLELIFGISLILGFKTRIAALGSALLTLSFALCMMATQGIAAPFKYPVFVFTGSGLVLFGLQYFRWSLDSLLSNKNS